MSVTFVYTCLDVYLYSFELCARSVYNFALQATAICLHNFAEFVFLFH